MEISPELKGNLLGEFEFIINRMKEEPDALKKMYFFSGTYGAIERVIRYCPVDELLIAHAILNICYGTLNDRINRIRAGDSNVLLPPNWAEQLSEYIEELRKAINEGRSVYPALEKVARLTYSATGPGFYAMTYNEYVKSREPGQEG